MKDLTRTEQVFECLKDAPDQPFTIQEIGNLIFQKYPNQSNKKRNRSKVINTTEELINQLASEINPAIIRKRYEKEIQVTDDSTLRLYYTKANNNKAEKQTAPAQSKVVDSKESKDSYEKHLYPILSKYLKSAHPKVYAKHIDDHPSKKGKGPKGNMWIHPDLVGVERASENWREEINNCVNKKPVLKLWSFEVKQEINSSNLRESFFQAVSNSTWANFGYLVAGKINFTNRKKREYIMSELRILSNLHGIGFIELNAESPLDSQILIPAKEREDVDWDTANRLFNENPDFKTYIKNVGLFYEKKHWNEEYWNRMKEPDSPTH